MKNALITGGAGFIGSNLADRLLESGFRCIIMDSFNDFYDPIIKNQNIAEIKDNMKNKGIDDESLLILKGDIRDEAFVEDCFCQHPIDYVLHLAAYAGVRPSIELPRLYMDVNINGTVNLLECAKRYNIQNFLFASSSSVYGENKIPFREDDCVDFPISPYAASKKAGELICYTYHSLYKTRVACARFFTVYGPRQRPDLAINKFVSLIEQDKPIPFFGDGSTSRDYTYIDDIVQGIIRMMEWISSADSTFEIFNLGGNGSITLNKMVQTIEQVLGKKALLDRQPIQSGDVKCTCADITKSQSVLGYNPKIDLYEGISRYVDWKKHRNNIS